MERGVGSNEAHIEQSQLPCVVKCKIGYDKVRKSTDRKSKGAGADNNNGK